MATSTGKSDAPLGPTLLPGTAGRADGAWLIALRKQRTDTALRDVLQDSFFGAAAGGTTREIIGSGGIVFAGAAPLNRTRSLAASGGLTFGGTATLSRTRSLAAAGGLTLGGSATLNRDRILAASGGLTLGGAGTLNRDRSLAASGGLTLSGEAVIERVVAPVTPPVEPITAYGSGAYLLGQARRYQARQSARRSREILGRGGLRFGGAATISRTRSLPGAGGLRFGGTAAAERVPGYQAELLLLLHAHD